jgi:hypothetical protein
MTHTLATCMLGNSISQGILTITVFYYTIFIKHVGTYIFKY